MGELRLSLIENARDFVLEAVKYTKAGTPRDWKYALLNLAAGLEIMMKALLDREHWTLVFQDVDDASRERLESGEFKSVDFPTAVKRLATLTETPISENDRAYMDKIRRLRNRMLHFDVKLTEAQAKAVLAQGLSVFGDLHEHVDQGAGQDDFLGLMRRELAVFQEFISVRLAKVRPQLKGAERPARRFRECPDCLQATLVVNEDEVDCLFCGSHFGPAELAAMSDGDGGPCPECEIGTLAFVLYNNEEGEFICVLCGRKFAQSHNRECERCGEQFWSTDGMLICEECFTRLAEKD